MRFSRRELLEAGWAARTIDNRVAAGVLHRLGRGQYATVAPDPRLRVAAAADRAGGRVGGTWALGLHGLAGFDLSGDRQITIPPERRVRGTDFVVVRSPLPAVDHAEVDGVPTVTVERALIDLAATEPASTVRAAYYDAKGKRLVTAQRLAARAHALGRVPGAAAVRRIAASGALDLDSEGEWSFLTLVFRAEDPKPQPQVWVAYEDRSYRLDFAYLDARMDLEYDGRDTHLRRFAADRERDLALAELNILTIRITGAMLREPADTRVRILGIRRQRLALDLPPIVPLER
jgi:hypothetical protein